MTIRQRAIPLAMALTTVLTMAGGCEAPILEDPLVTQMKEKEAELAAAGKISPPVAGAPSPPSPETPPPPPEPAKKSLRDPITLIKTSPVDISNKATLAEFNERFRRAREEKRTLPSGESELERLYEMVCSRGFQGARDADEVNQRLGQWAKEFPEENTPLVALARMALTQAERKRGVQYAGIVSQKREDQFTLSLINASDLAQQAAKRDTNDPELQRILLETGSQLGSGAEKWEDIVKASHGSGSRYYPLHAAIAKKIAQRPFMPRSAMVKYADDLRTTIGGDDGLEAYARVALVASQGEPDNLLLSGFSYDDLRRGGNLLHERYPQSADLLCFVAAVAFVTSDRELGNDLLPELLTKPADLNNWGGEHWLQAYKKWCERESRPDEADVKFWPNFRSGNNLAFVDGDKRLVTCSSGDFMQLWSVGQWALPPAKLEQKAHGNSCYLSSSRDGNQLLCGFLSSGYLFSFPLQRDLFAGLHYSLYTPHFPLHQHESPFFELAADGNRAITLGKGKLDLFNPKTGVRIREIILPESVKRLDGHARHLSPDGKWIALRDDNVFVVWDLEKGVKAFQVTHRDLKTHYLDTVIACAADGNLILRAAERTSGPAKAFVSNWNPTTSKLSHYCQINGTPIALLEEDLVAVATGTRAASYPDVVVHDLRTGNQVRKLVGHEQGVVAARFSSNGEWLATLEFEGPVRVWKLNGQRNQPTDVTDAATRQ